MATSQHHWLEHYEPTRRLFRNGHVQTIVGNFARRRHALPEPEAEFVEVEQAHDDAPATQVLCHSHWQAEEVRAQRLTVLLLHGLEGSSSSHYIVGNADKAWRAGCNVIRMNMRSCGGAEEVAPTIYHCGQSQDVGKVARHFAERFGLEQIALVGYSMGGNLVLRYAGEMGADILPQVKAVVGVSPAMDLALCSAALHEWRNRIYEQHFLRGMLKRYRYKATLFPQLYDPGIAAGVHTLREFDDLIVARYAGFADADDYYAKTSSSAVAQQIEIPALVIHALDDPFIRMAETTREKLLANPHATLVESQHGGHCAFLSEATAQDDAHWAEHTLLRFLLRMTPVQDSGRSSVMDARPEQANRTISSAGE